MHWAFKMAGQLIEEHPNAETFVCASGISPSGTVHIGNFREVVTSYFVVRALEMLGKNTRFIFSWDDFDRLRKVPANIDPAHEQYIGMPYSKIPDPNGCHKSYAAHFETEFENAVKAFGIDAEFIYQNKMYESGCYHESILTALNKRKDIYDITMKFKTGGPCEEDRENYYPVAIYCDACRKDDTNIIAYNQPAESIHYECSCGHHSEKAVSDLDLKLNWKIDWPMRWQKESVMFEPGGRDHSAQTGSYNVSKEIAKEIFDYKAPAYIAYDFIHIKGSQKKMSSSTGISLTPSDLLNVYSPELILFLFAKYQPDSAFHIGLDEDVIRNYTEFERYKRAFLAGTLKDDVIRQALELVLGEASDREEPSFSQLAGILPLVDFNLHLLQEVLQQNGEQYTMDQLKEVSERVEFWIKHYRQENVNVINEAPYQKYFDTLTDKEKAQLHHFADIVREGAAQSGEDLMREIYDICSAENQKQKKQEQKRLFQIIYQLVLNRNSGPRLPILIRAAGAEKIVELVTFDTTS
ncbi:lysine--tRNA ligase [Falsibacillus albus]|uniref:Lysine--tRNA ligase n=1 Tax=Falsibacillus albus TaxID=2478915 RepID=A0A3L7JTY5_9BACI|nr:lysine--tRNA ligase [Falsibacillus albus]RLQ94347.1 lysine--tRNA ligase [Falsibacillus albus]